MRCDHEFDVFTRGFIKEDERACPECGSSEVRQKFASFLRNGTSKTGSDCAAPFGSGFG
jgi:hypothetical protein